MSDLVDTLWAQRKPSGLVDELWAKRGDADAQALGRAQNFPRQQIRPGETLEQHMARTQSEPVAPEGVGPVSDQIGGFGVGLLQAPASLAKAAVDTAGIVAGLRSSPDFTRLESTGNRFQEAGQAIQRAATVPGVPETLGKRVGEGVGSVALSLPMGITGAAVTAGDLGFVAGYQRATDGGASPDRAMLAALGTGLTSGAGAVVPFHRILARINGASGGLLARTLADGVIFGGASGTQAVLNDVFQKFATGEDLNVLANVPMAAGEGALVGMIVGGATGAMTAKPSESRRPDNSEKNVATPADSMSEAGKGMSQVKPAMSEVANLGQASDIDLATLAPKPVDLVPSEAQTAPVEPGGSLAASPESGRSPVEAAPNTPDAIPGVERSVPLSAEPAPPSPVAGEGVSTPNEPAPATSAEPRPSAALKSAAEGRSIGVKNRSVDETLKMIGEEPGQHGEKRTDEGDWAKVLETVKADPEKPSRIVDEILTKNRPATTDEVGLLNHEMVKRWNARIEAETAIAEDPTNAHLKAKLADSEARYKQVADAATMTGTEQAQAFRARRLMARLDYSRERIEQRLRKANNNELSKEVIDEAASIADEVAAKQKLADEATKTADRERRILALESSLNEINEKLNKPNRGRTRERAIEKSKARIKDLFKELAEVGGSTARSGVPDPKTLKIVTELAVEHAKLGYHEFAKWAEEMVSQAGEKVRPYLDQAWNAAREEHAVRLTKKAKESLEELGRDPKEVSLENRIKRVEARIKDKELAPLGPEQGPDTANVKALKGRLDTLNKRLAEMKKEAKNLDPNLVRRDPKEIAVEKNIARLEERIARGDLNARGERQGPNTEALTALKAHRDNLQARLQESRDSRAMDEKIAALEEKIAAKDTSKAPQKQTVATEKQDRIAKLNSELAEMRKRPQSERQVEAIQKRIERLKSGAEPMRTSTVDTAEVAAARSELAELVKQRAATRKAENPPRTHDEIVRDNYIKAKKKQLDRLNERLMSEDFAPRDRKKARDLSKPEIEAKVEYDKAKRKIDLAEMRYERAHRSKIRKLLEGARDVAGAGTDILLSVDLPPVFRQGALFTATHPILSSKAFAQSFEAIATKAGAERLQARLESHPDFAKLRDSGVDFTGYGDTLAAQEENIRSLISKHIPLVAHSQRGFVAFMNLQRFMAGRAMMEAIPEGSKADMKAIASFVNDATGRGKLSGRWDPGLEILRLPFLAPRLYVSRFRLLSRAISGGTAFTTDAPLARKLIAREMATFAGALTAALGLATYMGADVDWDWRDKDALEVKVGPTTIDLSGQMSQYYTLIGQLATGEQITDKGDVADKDIGSTLGYFALGKAQPPIKAYLDFRKGTDYDGDPVTAFSAVRDMISPVSPRDVYQTIKRQGFSKGVAIGLLGLLGAGIRQQKKKTHK